MENRVLFVVRDREMREHLAETFGGRGLHVITAADGVGGLFQFGLRQPDLIVLDVSGWDILQRIRTLSDIPIIVLVEDTLQARIESLDRGADYFLVKPPSVSELGAKIRVLLRRKTGIQPGLAAASDLSLPLGIS